MNEQEWVQGLRPLGKLFYKWKLIFYDPIDWGYGNIDFSWNYWYILEKIICFFKGHIPEQFYRLPKEGEKGLVDKMGCVKADVCCMRCWRRMK